MFHGSDQSFLGLEPQPIAYSSVSKPVEFAYRSDSIYSIKIHTEGNFEDPTNVI